MRMAVRQPWRTIALVELGAMFTVLLSYIWLWQGTFRGSAALILVLYFGVGIASHLHRRESPREIGLRADNFPRALRNVALIVVPATAVPLAIGYAMRSWHFSGWVHPIAQLVWMLTWATAQQYGLLCFFYRRFLDVFGGPVAATAGASVAFATMHAPNGFLVAVTLVAGVIACTLYRREANVLAIGIGHAAISYVLLCALPYSVTHGLRVGPGYLALP